MLLGSAAVVLVLVLAPRPGSSAGVGAGDGAHATYVVIPELARFFSSAVFFFAVLLVM